MFLAERVPADFSGPYAVPDPGLFFPNNLPNRPAVTPVGTWTLSVDSSLPLAFPNSYITTHSSNVVLNTGTDFNHGFDSLELQLTNTIVADGTLSFDYVLDLLATGPAAVWNFGGYIVNGVVTNLPAGTGSVTLPVSAGDIIGFDVYGSVTCIQCLPGNSAGSATLTITNFIAPVPEPTTTALFVSSAVLAFVRARARRRVASLKRS